MNQPSLIYLLHLLLVCEGLPPTLLLLLLLLESLHLQAGVYEHWPPLHGSLVLLVWDGNLGLERESKEIEQ